jgi:hypothetical protein
MPKIPTFRTEATITGEVGSVKSNIQMGLNQTIGNVLAPVTKEIVQHRVKQKDFENKTEALRLENDFVRDMQSVYDQAGNLENQDQAQNLVKTQSNILMKKYSGLASNRGTQDLFNQYALSEVQKGIFRTTSAVERNTLIALDTLVNEKKQKLMITAIDTDEGFDYAVLGRDLEDLYTTNYKGKVSDAVLGRMISGIPNEIKFLEAEKMISNNPREALEMLKDEKDFVGLNYDSRVQLIEKAKKTLVPLIDSQWRSHVEQINDGQDVEPFDLDLVAEVLPEEAANAMIQQETIFRDTADNVKTIHRSSEQDVFEVAQGFIQEAKEMYLYDKAKDIEKFYNSIVAQRSEDIKNDPVEYTIRTSPDIKNLVQKLESEQNPDIAASLSKEIAFSIMEYQTNNLGIKKTNQKVMTNSASKQFITEYKQAAKDKNINLQDAMLQGLVTKYGNLEDEALAQLTLDGLPTGARFISAGFATQEDKMKFLSLDDPNIIKDLKKDLKDRDDSEISFSKMRSLIRQDSNFKDLENIIKRNVPFDPSDEIPIIEDVVEFLAGYGSLEFTNGDTKTFNAAAKKAVEMFTKNFDIEDTYYYEKTFIDSTTGKTIVPQKIQRNKDMMEIIKNNYLSKLNLATFSSKKEGIASQELTEKMQYNMREHGEWRNSPDGKGFVFGIVLSGNSFGIVEYENGDPLYFPKDHDGDTIPGSDIVVDLDIESKIQMSRGYFGYQEKMNEKDFSLGKRPSEIPEGAFGETIGIPNMDAEASEISPSIDSSFETYIKDVENKKLKSGNVKHFRHKSPEGGLDTIGFGHKLTPEEQETNTVYGYDLSTITKDNVEEISNDILKKDLQKTEQILIKTHGEKFINLDSRRKQMLIDFQFNVRNFKNKDVFPLFKKALFAGDEEGMKKEYKRFFKSNGKTKSLARNDFFKKYFLDK